MVEKNIKLGIIESITSKVVMTRMVELDGYKAVLGTKMFKKGDSREVPRVAIGISSDINRTLVGGDNFFQEQTELRQS